FQICAGAKYVACTREDRHAQSRVGIKLLKHPEQFVCRPEIYSVTNLRAVDGNNRNSAPRFPCDVLHFLILSSEHNYTPSPAKAVLLFLQGNEFILAFDLLLAAFYCHIPRIGFQKIE